ncbi:hypothetical protein QTP88_004904 [Uroleucon formosanum]
MLIPSTKDVVSDPQDSQIKRHGKQQHDIQQGDTVAVRDYRTNENKWSIGIVTKNVGKQAFEVDTEAGTWKRHINQTIKIPNGDSGALCLPENPDNKTFESLSDILLKHYEPKKSYFVARHRLYLARKNHDESVPQWGARVRELASKCGFGPELEIVVRDIFVTGMGSGKIQDRLLEEDVSAASTTLAK